MNPINEEHRPGGVSSSTGGHQVSSAVQHLKHRRGGLGLLLVAFFSLCATAVAVPGVGGEEALPQVVAEPLAAHQGGELLHAANTKAGKKGSASPLRSKSGGETEATKRGRQAHKDWDPGEGFKKEVRLPSGKRADAVNSDKQEVKELKPDNSRAVKRGERQVEEYRRELEETEGGSWTGKVETYKPDKPEPGGAD